MFQNGFRAALIQCRVGKDRIENLENASKLIEIAKANGAQVVALPERFNSPRFINKYAESIPDGPTSKMLSNAAKKHSLFLIGGTFPERDNNKLYNTCTVWNPSGEMIAKFRKLHLFDVDIAGGITFKESDMICEGNDLITFEMNGVTVGLGICYDMRFEELAKLYCLKGCKLLVYPGAFNMTTGPLHWELLQRARALDNQLYVFAISRARGDKGYIAWGYSQVTDPWGKVIAQAGHDEEIIYADVNLTECEKIPGGSVALFNDCTSQFGAPADGWGNRYGGVSRREKCNILSDSPQSGVYWRFDWFKGADDNEFIFHRIRYPSQRTDITDYIRADGF